MGLLSNNGYDGADEEEFAECPSCGEMSIPMPTGFGILFRTARCNDCGASFGKWRNILDETFELTRRKAMRD